MFLGIEELLLIFSVIIFFGILLGKLGTKFGVPTLLLFLFSGMIFGVDGLGLEFEDAEMVQDIGMIALAIILFTGGMDTKLKEVKTIMPQGVVLATIGVLLTTLFTGSFIYWISNQFLLGAVFSFPVALLLAATMSSTDSASVFAILRTQKIQLKENLRPILELESGSNDPMAYMLTIILIEYIFSQKLDFSAFALQFAQQFFIGGGLGLVSGAIAVFVINHININNRTLYPILLLCILFTAFPTALLLNGNGYLTVYIAGIVVGNSRLQNRSTINHFFEGITWLVQIILFILLGLLVSPHEMPEVLVLALFVALFIIFIARPFACFLSLTPFRKLSFKGKAFLSWVGLRGAAPILFATYPIVSQIDGARHIFNIVFIITLLSLSLQGMSITHFARLLGLSTPAPPSGNFFGIEIPDDMGTALEEKKVNSLLLANGDKLRDLPLKEDELVILVRRKSHFIVPKGELKLHLGDILLIVSQYEPSNALPSKTRILFERMKETLLNENKSSK